MAKTKQSHGRHNSLETLSEFGGAFSEAVTEDLGKKTAETFLSQLLGIKSPSEKAGDNQSAEGFKVTNPFTPGTEGDIFHAKDHHAKAKTDVKRTHADRAPSEKAHKPERREAAIDHREFQRTSERASASENREINQRLQEIMSELKRLVSSSKVLQMEFANVDVEQAPTQAGEYHINFFDWLLLTIRSAREKVENSGAWAATLKSKKGKGKWGKKERQDWFGNTSRSLSSEVTASNQTG